METRDAKLYSQNKFEINLLRVDRELLGAQHQFPFQNSLVVIRIPGIDQVFDGKNLDQFRYSWASFGPQRGADDQPLNYDIHRILVEVSIPIVYPFPADAFNRPAVAHELYSQEEFKKIDKIATQHGILAAEAFEYWLRIVQWTCSDSRIGGSDINAYRNPETRLFDQESDAKLWIESHLIVLIGTTTITTELWQEIQSRLEAGIQPPIYIDLKHNAEESFRIKDYRRSLIEMAMACETFMRFAVLQKLPKELNNELAKYIEDAKIYIVQKDFFPSTLSGEALQQYREIKPDLELLFRKRNILVHTGKSEGVDAELCSGLLQVTQKLLSIKHD